MHRILILLLLMLYFAPAALAQETVHPITVERKPNDFYVSQTRLWDAVTKKEPQNKTAWWNLYLAMRYKDFPAIFSDTTYKKEVNAMVENMGRAIPESYEYHYIYAWNGGFGKDNFSHLLTAYKLDSSRPKILEDLFTHYHCQSDEEMANYYMRKWYEAKSMTPQLMHFSYNLLASTEKNGILFLSGDNDSYPTWMLQMVKEIRPDVATFNVYLINDPKYARKMLEKYDVKVDEEAYKLLDRSSKDIWKNMVKFIQHLHEKNPDRNVYLTPTMVKQIQEELEKDLYIVGSVFQYSPERFDNIAVLKRNWHHNMKLDYLDFMVYGDDYHYSPEGLPYTLYIYLYPAVTLYLHYKEAGETQKAEELLSFSRKISEALGDDDLYKKFIKKMAQ